MGSSVNSGYFDLALPGAVLADRDGQLVHPSIAATATPGSRQILSAIAESGVYRQLVEGGVRMLEPVCGPCVGMGHGAAERGELAAHLQPQLPGPLGHARGQRLPVLARRRRDLAAARGDHRPARVRRPARRCSPPPELKPYVEDVHIFAPASEEEAERIEIPRGPEHQGAARARAARPRRCARRIATVQPDDISTGDLAPDGVEVMSYRSNIPAIAEFTFRHRDPEFRKRMQRVGRGLHRRRRELRPGLIARARGAGAAAARRQGGVREVVRAHPPPQPRGTGHPRAHLRRRRRLRPRARSVSAGCCRG